MGTPRTSIHWMSWLIVFAATAIAHGQQPPAPGAKPAPPGLPPLFFREEWRQRDRPPDAGQDFVPEAGVTSTAVTNSNLELRLYDPNAKTRLVIGSTTMVASHVSNEGILEKNTPSSIVMFDAAGKLLWRTP